MKLLIQIPCYNESATLPSVLKRIPAAIPGIDAIETLVIDDGSTDGTSEIAHELGATYVIRNTSNLGLALTFRRGIDECLRRGADLIVNLDGDSQYDPQEIPKLILPLLERRADIVVGDRQTDTLAHFNWTKRLLQRFGSGVVRRLSGTQVKDTVSGFRAFTKSAALKLTILSYYSYTIESILQAQSKGLTIENVPITAHRTVRESRLMKSLRSYLAFSTATIIRIFTMYNPLRVFLQGGSLLVASGLVLGVRFLYFYFTKGGQGHVQSLILAAILCLSGMMVIVAGLLADLIQFNRRLLEDILERVRRLELNADQGAPDINTENKHNSVVRSFH